MQKPVILDHRIGAGFHFHRPERSAGPLHAAIIGQQILDEARGARAEPLDHAGQPPGSFAVGRRALQFAAGMIQADILGLAVGERAVKEFILAVGKPEWQAGKIQQLAVLQRGLRAHPRLIVERPRPLRKVETLQDHANDSVMAPYTKVRISRRSFTRSGANRTCDMNTTAMSSLGSLKK